MRFTPTPAQADFRQRAAVFADQTLRPAAAELDQQGAFPHAMMGHLADQGMLGVNVPVSDGGAGAGTIAYSLAMMEIARGCAATAVTMAVTNMVAEVIVAFGSDAQRRMYVPAITSGTFAAASFALSEPEAGSDPGAMTTTATRTATGWMLSGQKQWITSGDVAGVLVVWARTGGPGTRGISCFLVPRGTPGMHVGAPEKKLGLRASSTVPLTFDDCLLPADALLGPPESGFKIAMMALDGGRIGIASQACGIAAAALDGLVQRSRQPSPPTGFGPLLADSQMELDAACALTLRAAWRKEQDRPHSREAAMAKLYASEMVNRVCQRTVRVTGLSGYLRAAPFERHLRDARVTTLYEGTSEIQRIVIARQVLEERTLFRGP